MAKKKVFTQTQVRSALDKMVQALLKSVKEPAGTWALVGIHSRGVPLAKRLAAALKAAGTPDVPVGSLDITFYRDDMGEAALHPIVQDTDVSFDVSGKTVFLVDDVLYTGRTIRCALDELMDFGRPRRVYLAVLVDRGQRELPIQPDFVGETMLTPPDQRVEVHLEEVDGEDAVWIAPSKKEASPL
jgi:pyrimidine operon attenuation protein/uracil phosphoribosyltransferase